MDLYKINYKNYEDEQCTIYVYAEFADKVFEILKEGNVMVCDGFMSMELLEEFRDNIIVQYD